MVSSVKRVSFLAAAASLLLSGVANAGLADCPKNLAFQLTNVFQIGNIKFQYGNCEKDNEGKGYAAGIANFCTGTGDAWEVIQAYHKINGGSDEFSKYDKVLAERAKSGSGSIAGLEGFCDVWKGTGVNQKFWSAQGEVYDKLYYTPSQNFADKLGMKLSVSQAAMYDAAISRGTSNSTGSLGGMISETNKGITKDISGDSNSTLKIGKYSVDEVKWLGMFLDVWAKYQDKGANSVHIKSFKYIIQKKEYTWVHEIEVLNNEGKPGNLTCDNTYLPYPDQKTNPLATCGDMCSEVEASFGLAVPESLSKRVTGGYNTAQGLAPFAASLVIDVDGAKVFCTGTFISESDIVTAGGCLIDSTNQTVPDTSVTVGYNSNNLKTQTTVRSKSVNVHPDFVTPIGLNLKYDIEMQGEQSVFDFIQEKAALDEEYLTAPATYLQRAK
ncbi:hypothetical protein GGI07_004058 [Coemansia sp. Benny D115]|nr:hypothetical protein GGI07_004058 [Coemansia sp. Benny D115]